LIRTVLTYGIETWTFSKNSENALSTFARKILRRIYGPVQDNGQWRVRYNKELYELYGMYQTEKASMGGTCPEDGRHTNS
jgi:hypothetical protein